MGSTIVVDGARGEGGGQVVRAAVALAALTRQDCRVVNIRAARANPGLAAQHVAGVQAVAALCGAKVSGLAVGSREIVFRPTSIVAARPRIDVGTAGSVALVLQACLPVAFAAPGDVHLTFIGGTDVPWSPPLDYLSKVFLPFVRRLGGHAELVLRRRGYYPRGGGTIEVTVHPVAAWSPLDLPEPGAVRSIRGIAHVANLPPDIPKRIGHAAMRRLHGRGEVRIEERVSAGDEAVGQGGALVLWAETEHSLLGASCLAERGKSSERVGEEAAAALVAEIDSGASVDVHLADQILLYLARAPGPSRFRVREASGHLRTMAWLLELMVGRQILIEPIGARWQVRVAGPA